MEVDITDLDLQLRHHARVALDGRRRIPLEGDESEFGREDPPDQIGPTARSQVHAQRYGVVEHSADVLPSNFLRPAVNVQGHDQVPLAAQQAEHLEVSRQKHALEGHLEPPREIAQAMEHRLGHPGDVRPFLAGRSTRPSRPTRCPDWMSAGQRLLPVPPAFLGGQSLALQTDELPIRQRQGLFFRSPLASEEGEVEFLDLSQGLVGSPPLGDGVGLGHRHPEAGFAQAVQEETEQGGLRGIEYPPPLPP